MLLTLPGLAEAAASGGCLRCYSPPGRFGELCCGCLQLPGRQELPVAVHTLREGCSDSQRLSFLAEALTLGQFDHSHVVRLEGVVTRGRAGAPPAWGEGGAGGVGGGLLRPQALFAQSWEGALTWPSMERAQVSITDSRGL